MSGRNWKGDSNGLDMSESLQINKTQKFPFLALTLLDGDAPFLRGASPRAAAAPVLVSSFH